MTTADPTTRYVDALTEISGVMLDSARLAAQFNMAVTQQLIDQARQAQQRRLGLVRRFIEQPSDLTSNVAALADAAAEARAQRLDLLRAPFERTPELRTEREALADRLVKANEEMFGAAVAAGRDYSTNNPWLQAMRANPLMQAFAPTPAGG